MADLYDLTKRVLARFDGVPKVTALEAEAWAQTAIERHGYAEADEIPTDEIYLVLILAQAEGARQIALRTAHYFNYQDGDERVDQAEVSATYLRLSNTLFTDYQAEAVKSGKRASKFRTAKRLDR
jgi:hypothetical protein